MFAAKPAEFPNDQSTFIKICQFARTGNIPGLKHLFENGVSVGQHEHELTAVMLFASENNSKAMWLLINRFNASLNQAVQGAASGNHHELVDALLAEGASRLYAVRGYGLCGNLEKIEAILAAVDEDDKEELCDAALDFLARGGHVDKMRTLFANNKHMYWDLEPVSAMQGCAYAGLDEQISLLEDDNSGLSHEKIRGYAQAGREDKVSEMLQKDKTLISSAIEGYIEGGFIALGFKLYAERLQLMHSFDDFFSLNCLASVGQQQLVDEALRHTYQLLQPEQAAAGYAANGDLKNIELLINKHCRTVTDNLIVDQPQAINYSSYFLFMSQIVKSLYFGGCFANESIATRMMSFIDSDDIRNCLLEHAGKTYYGYLADGSDNSTRMRIYNNATNINRLMRDKDIDFDEARKLAGCQLNEAARNSPMH